MKDGRHEFVLDRISFLSSLLIPKFGNVLTERLLGSWRKNTISQQQVGWKALQNWILLVNPENINIYSLMEFLNYLHVEKKLETTTIRDYKNSIAFPLKLAIGIDFNSWEFKKLNDAFFIDKPPKKPSVPNWELDKVLTLLQSDKFDNSKTGSFMALRKCLFLTALACGNRVSEIAAFQRTSIVSSLQLTALRIPVKPGFLFKNQRQGRCPPGVEIYPLLEGPSSLCPVLALQRYLSVSTPTRGALFCHSKTQAPLRSSSISKLLCGLIEEANPGCFPKAHDVRKLATSLAWCRGLDTSEITKRAFWKSSSTFIERYLSKVNNISGVALNTC